MFTVYAIKSERQNYIYVGMTSDLSKRINAHNSGYEKTTKAYRPFVLIYEEVFEVRIKAREKEKYLKTTSGKRFLRKQIT